MNAVDFTIDQWKVCALKCPLKLPKHDGPVDVRTGNWWLMPAKNEIVKKYVKQCKKDIFEREIRKTMYEGYLGQTVIGGHQFVYCPKGPVIVRVDFFDWCSRNWHKALNADGTERDSNKPLHDDNVRQETLGFISFQAKSRAKDLPEVTDLIHKDAWNPLYDMRLHLQNYVKEMARDKAAGNHFIVTKVQADTLAAMVAYKERDYQKAIDGFVWVAAAALKAAEFVAAKHSKENNDEH